MSSPSLVCVTETLEKEFRQYKSTYCKRFVGPFQYESLYRSGVISSLQPYYSPVASWYPYCKIWALSLLGQALSSLTPVHPFISHMPPFQPRQAGCSSYNLPCTLHLCSYAVPSTQDGLPSSICLQVPSCSLKLSPRIVSSGPFSLNAPPCPGLLASGVPVSSWCCGW